MDSLHGDLDCSCVFGFKCVAQVSGWGSFVDFYAECLYGWDLPSLLNNPLPPQGLSAYNQSCSGSFLPQMQLFLKMAWSLESLCLSASWSLELECPSLASPWILNGVTHLSAISRWFNLSPAMMRLGLSQSLLIEWLTSEFKAAFCPLSIYF